MVWSRVSRYLVVMLALALPMSISNAGNTLGKRMSIAVQGYGLHKDIEQTYARLRAERRLTTSFLGNDITPILLKHIPLGATFEEAENILRAAGFTIGPRETRYVGPGEKRYGETAWIKGFAGGFWYGYGVDVGVALTPRSPDDYSIVVDITGHIFLNTL